MTIEIHLITMLALALGAVPLFRSMGSSAFNTASVSLAQPTPSFGYSFAAFLMMACLFLATFASYVIKFVAPIL